MNSLTKSLQKIDKIIKILIENELTSKYYFKGASILQEEFKEKMIIYLSVLSVLPLKLSIDSLITPNGLNLDIPRYYGSNDNQIFDQ